jgi:hypothetical protein
MISDHIVKETGRPDKFGNSLINLRDGGIGEDGIRHSGLVPELDRLNPAYKTARDAWSGDTQSFMALDKGRHLLDKKWFPSTEHLAEELNKMSAGDRELAKLGLAEELRQRLSEKVDSADKSKIINNEFTRERVRALLGPDAERFLEAMERERTMEATRFETYGGSPTRLRAAADERKRQALESGGGFVYHLLHGHLPSAFYHAMRGRRALAGTPDLPMNEAVGRIVTDPNLDISAASGPVLPPIQVPQRYMMTPGRALAGGDLAMPHEDDPVARALGYAP